MNEEILRENKSQSTILTWPTAGQCSVVSQALELDVHQIIPYLIQHTFANWLAKIRGTGYKHETTLVPRIHQVHVTLGDGPINS